MIFTFFLTTNDFSNDTGQHFNDLPLLSAKFSFFWQLTQRGWYSSYALNLKNNFLTVDCYSVYVQLKIELKKIL